MSKQKDLVLNNTEMVKDDLSLVETEELILSSKSSSTILLNGDKKSNMLYNLRNIIDFENDKSIDYVTISVPYAVIPNSMYNVNDYTNKLVVEWGGSIYTYTFPNGNYTYSSFITAFSNVLPNHFTLSFNQVTSRYTITNNLYQFWLLETSTIDFIMGFSGFQQSTNVSPYTLEMPRVVCFLPTPIINICCNEINNGQALGQDSNPLFSNILASVPNTTKLNNELVYQNVSDEFVMKNVSHNTLTISLLDDSGRFIDFNGISSFFLIRLKIHKKYKTIKGSFNDFLTNATKIRNLIEEE